MIENETILLNFESSYSNSKSNFFPLCSSPIFPNISRDLSFPDSLTPCLTFFILPVFQIVFSFPCFLFLLVYGHVVKAPKLLLNKILISKLILAFVIFVSSTTRLIITLFYENEPDEFFPEEKFGIFCYFFSVLFLFLSEIVRWYNGILSSIWLQICWVLQLCCALTEYTFVSSNHEVSFQY